MMTEEGVRELSSRLPNVSETVIAHFLSKCSNVEECYEKLKDGTFQLTSPPPDRSVTFVTNRTNAVEVPASSGPSTLNRYPTYPDTTDRPTNEPFRSFVSEEHEKNFYWGQESNGEMSFPGQQDSFSSVSPRMSHVQHVTSIDTPGTPLSFTGSPTRSTRLSELVAAQQEALENIQKIRDNYIDDLSKFRDITHRKKEELSQLRVKVSEKCSTREELDSTKDLITTLQFDIHDMKQKVAIEKSQVEMKSKRDVYTEEGRRWQCQHCAFLNHPLMSRCEKCDRPNR